MTSQLYLSGKLQSNPEIATTRKGKPWVKILLETELIRADGRDGLQTETVVLPVHCFSGEAAAVKNLAAGATVTLGAHLYGTKFQADGGPVKHGVQIVADQIFIASGGGRGE